MGFDVADRFVLAGEIVQHPRQQGVFVDVGQISGVVDVLVAEHGRLWPGGDRTRNG